ncbi:hypothetical protein [Halotia branconii]|uniref:Uncharacterized protein n=1 Tax=Halotia branconii CENA392 TaxID=1539056 RepID=A0AAJ6NQW5_9CYAN|nr:hypothetical protein [Halotia branconii]WGV24849.1 hypothetical protein QI031_24275 [Halotia branconii CENA392]
MEKRNWGRREVRSWGASPLGGFPDLKELACLPKWSNFGVQGAEGKEKAEGQGAGCKGEVKNFIASKQWFNAAIVKTRG